VLNIIIPNNKIPINCNDSRGELGIFEKPSLDNIIHVQIVTGLCYLLITGKKNSRKGSLGIPPSLSNYALNLYVNVMINSILHTLANLHLGMEITQFQLCSPNVGKSGLRT